MAKALVVVCSFTIVWSWQIILSGIYVCLQIYDNFQIIDSGRLEVRVAEQLEGAANVLVCVQVLQGDGY